MININSTYLSNMTENPVNKPTTIISKLYLNIAFVLCCCAKCHARSLDIDKDVRYPYNEFIFLGGLYFMITAPTKNIIPEINNMDFSPPHKHGFSLILF